VSNDILTMLWKELKEFIRMRGTKQTGMIGGLLLPVGILGILMPLRSGAAWVTGSTSLTFMGWLPMFMALSMIADSFAGERERHTLETLLATRLSDQAILVGKIASAVLYSWGLVVVSLITGLITVNIAHGHGRLLMFPPGDIATLLVFSLLLGTLASCAGVLVSLRAATVRQAAQTLSYGFLVLVFAVVFGARMLPTERMKVLINAVAPTNLLRTEILVAMGLAAVDFGLYSVVRMRFQRARLILD
jgi:ABC-2 type transport system permease protein